MLKKDFMNFEKIIIFTSSYIINNGVFVLLNELNSDIEVKKVLTKKEFHSTLKHSNFDYLITDNEELTELCKLNFSNIITNKKIILLGKEDSSFSSNLKIIKRICLSAGKDEINDIFLDIFKQRDSSESSEISEREREIIKLVALGKTNKDIAEDLFLSIHTVITHRKNISKKLGIKTISGLTIYAILNNIIDIDDKNTNFIP